ncbi:MAG: hypothetical protein LBD88_00710 [Candidatus Peribacteria bacterium]|jgi:hypothetical protein|nr:hypothetical protein [Candidatus Peribacteria bacterium]
MFKYENLSDISFDNYFKEYENNKEKKKNNKEAKLDYNAKNDLIKNITNLYFKSVYFEDIKQEVLFENLLKEEVL